ncbi:MAG: BBP7 family outer membrane beta-barrel protein [Pseudomonadales bacterium]
MKNLIVLLIVGLLAASCLGVVAAQELLVAPGTGDIDQTTPEIALPALPDLATEGDYSVDNYSGETIDEYSEEIENTPTDQSFSGDEYSEGLVPYAMDNNHMYQCDQALLESTGTWIRRGFWYAEVDAVIFNREWNRDPIFLATQLVGTSVNPILGLQAVENQLAVNGSKPGMEAAPRFTLGHFLFRDHKNRDHVGEFTAYGGGEWTEEALLNANPNNDQNTTTLTIPVVADGGNLSFDGATSSNFRYDSRFNNFELNYLLKERMGRDHMEMEPSGHWVRRAGPSISRSFLVGVRFFDLNEDFDWEASGIDPDGNPQTDDVQDDDIGSARVHTDNDMFGTQVGFTWTYETARWSGGVRAKGGMLVNLIDARYIFQRTQNLTGDDLMNDTALQADELGFIGEAALQGKWHLRPNLSLRAGLEVLFVTSTALAPHQFPDVFIPGGPTRIVSTGDPYYLGGSIGFEGYW